jgi:hypothetical protein
MGRLLTRDDFQASLTRHDPVGAWSGGVTSCDYESEAAGAASELGRVLGLGHILTVVADNIDRHHPGFYAASRSDAGAARIASQRIARELWDIHGVLPPRSESPAGETPGDLPELDTAAVAANPGALIDWLRSVEAALTAVPPVDSVLKSDVGTRLLAILPRICDEYAGADATACAAMRDAFSRFRLTLYVLSQFAAMQSQALTSASSGAELRHLLMAESLLDMGTDWRDELLMLQNARRRAETSGLPFDRELEEAAVKSSDKTAAFLRGVR